MSAEFILLLLFGFVAVSVTAYRLFTYLYDRSRDEARDIFFKAVHQGWKMRHLADSSQGGFTTWNLHNKNGAFELSIHVDLHASSTNAWAAFIDMLIADRNLRALYAAKVNDPESQREPATTIGSRHSKW